MKSPRALLLATLLASACGAAQYESHSQEVPATPKGTLSGQVLSSKLTPLSGADVSLTLGSAVASKKVATDADGAFAFTGLPGGSQILVTVSKPGFASLRSTAVIPAAAGNFPLDGANVSVGPFTLAELGATVRFVVLTPRGAPAAGAHATLEVSPAGSDLSVSAGATGSQLSAVVVDSDVDATGLLSFVGVPAPIEIARYGGAYKLWVAPLDGNGDGVSESGGFAAAYAGTDLVNDPSPRLAQLAPPAGRGALRVDGGNVGSLKTAAENAPARNMLKPGEPLLLVFSQPLVDQSVLVRITNEDASEHVGFAKLLAAGAQVLSISPSEPIVAGAEYNIRVQAVGVGGGVYEKTGFFFGGDPASAVGFGLKDIRYQESSTALPSRLTTGERVYVDLNQVVTRQGTDGQHVQVFFSSDIDGDNKVGASTVGELGNATGRGFDLLPDEPVKALVRSLLTPEIPQFPVILSGYTTRWSFVYPGSVTLDPGAVEISVAFSALAQRTDTTYLTMWGQPVETDVKASPVIIPPPEGSGN